MMAQGLGGVLVVLASRCDLRTNSPCADICVRCSCTSGLPSLQWRNTVGTENVAPTGLWSEDEMPGALKYSRGWGA